MTRDVVTDTAFNSHIGGGLLLPVFNKKDLGFLGSPHRFQIGNCLTLNIQIMDYKMYSEELEKIIEAIMVPEHTRILVDGLVKTAKEKCKGDNHSID